MELFCANLNHIVQHFTTNQTNNSHSIFSFKIQPHHFKINHIPPSQVFFISVVKKCSFGFADLGDFIVATEGASDGDSLGAVDGAVLGAMDGSALGLSDGAAEGASDGCVDGATVGNSVGDVEGATLGPADGATDGLVDGADGFTEVTTEGDALGAVVGALLGNPEGVTECATLGPVDGASANEDSLGLVDGTKLGAVAATTPSLRRKETKTDFKANRK
jgi:hypothetical protein